MDVALLQQPLPWKDKGHNTERELANHILLNINNQLNIGLSHVYKISLNSLHI